MDLENIGATGAMVQTRLCHKSCNDQSEAHMQEFPEMSHLFPDFHLDATSCRAGLVRCLFGKPLHYLLLILLAIDVLTVVVGRRLKSKKSSPPKKVRASQLLCVMLCVQLSWR